MPFSSAIFTQCLIGPGRNPRTADAPNVRRASRGRARLYGTGDSLGFVLKLLLLRLLHRLPLHQGRLRRRSIHCLGELITLVSGGAPAFGHLQIGRSSGKLAIAPRHAPIVSFPSVHRLTYGAHVTTLFIQFVGIDAPCGVIWSAAWLQSCVRLAALCKGLHRPERGLGGRDRDQRRRPEVLTTNHPPPDSRLAGHS